MSSSVATIWGGINEWIITQSGTWTVPKTGKYMLELYGGGGGSNQNAPQYQSGSSCQHYNSISLTKGQNISVTIGLGGDGSMYPSPGGSTTFGSYTVDGGEPAGLSAGGAGAGNRGTTGGISYEELGINASTGELGNKYGYGVNGYPQTARGMTGAVYLKYLGI